MNPFRKLAFTAILLTGAASAQTFSASLTYNTQEAPTDIVLADVNHDGFMDVLALQPNAHSVSVMLNDGTGALHQVGVFNANTNGGAFGVRGGIAVGDFNGDGNLDIVTVGDNSGQTVSVLLGNGNGTFQAPVSYTVVGAPNSVAVGDFNNDGKMDIASLSFFSNKITILTNTGSGFTASSFAAPLAFGGADDALANLTAGDFNGDGRMDLAYSDLNQCVKVPACAQSTFTFFTLFNTTTGWQKHVAGTGPAGDADGLTSITVHAVDVDNDGKADLLVSNGFAKYVNVFYSNGNGTFQSVQAKSSTNTPVFLDAVAADFNNNGVNDIAAAAFWEAGNSLRNGIVVFTGKGGRSGFNQPVFFASNSDNVSNFIGAGLFRAQTRKDVIAGTGPVVNNVVLEFRNTASTAAEPCPYPVSPAIHYCGPANGSAVTGPGVSFKATARARTGPVNRIELWVDGHKLFQTFSDRLNHTQTLSKGTHAATLVEVDSAGALIKTNVSKFTVK
jgi:hypothetical protein